MERKDRLEDLKIQKFLTSRIFPRVSENMHYEIFKYINSDDMLEVRMTTLGGYQLTSNNILRSRIGNYFYDITPELNEDQFNIYEEYEKTKKEKEEDRKDRCKDAKLIKLIFEQTGRNCLNFEDLVIGNKGIIKLVRHFRFNSCLQELNLCNIIIYIYM